MKKQVHRGLGLFVAVLTVAALSGIGLNYAQADSTTSTATTVTSSTTTPTTATPASTPVTIMVMQHICNTSIQTVAEFKAAGDFAHQVVACPTIALPGNALSPNAASGGNYTFDFSLTNPSNTTTQTLSGGNATFAQQKICESDINEDLNGDGVISPTTCLDISNYVFGSMPRGVTTLTQTMAPVGTRFGAMQFTPAALNNNVDDSTSKISINANGVTIDSTLTPDPMIMLHIYNFQNVGTAGSTGTTVTPTAPTTPTSISGMVVVPISVYDMFYNITMPATGSTTPPTTGNSTGSTTTGTMTGTATSGTGTVTYVNGYPTMGGNYYDCYGNIDNDMAHHTTASSDMDPAHHIGQYCPAGSMFFNGSSASTGASGSGSTSSTASGTGTITSGQMDGQYGLIPLTLPNLEKLITLFGGTTGTAMGM